MAKFASVLLFAGLLVSLALQSTAMTRRDPAVAGQFYPADPDALREMVTAHLDNVTGLPDIDGRIIALIVPHAGLVYSGQIAAYGYKLIEGREIDKVILCGPSHRHDFDGLSVYGHNIGWRTPLGNIICDDSLCLRLVRFHDKIQHLAAAHVREHSLEVQLPYLQTVLDTFKIAPIAMGRPTAATIDLLTRALKAQELGPNSVMIVSTDWQHYRPASAGWPMDSLGLDCLRKLDPDRLRDNLAMGRVEMCGGGVAVAVMQAAIDMGADRVKILKYGDSGDISGKKDEVVGYVAAVIYRSGEAEDEPPPSSTDAGDADDPSLPIGFELTRDDRETLLDIARKSITAFLATGDIPDFAVNDNLEKYGAAFVTLTKNDRLRGCIGYTRAMTPLYKTVSECAVKAAVSDRRFAPVESGEMDDIHIEISVLTPLQEVTSLDEIEVGRDGLMIFRGHQQGLLLPQVATDNGWDRQTFLEQTCRKAGLPVDAYLAPETILYKFQAIIFEE